MFLILLKILYSWFLLEYKAQKYSLEEFPDLKELREYMVSGPVELCIERAKLMTDFLKKKGGLDYTDPFTRQAEILYHILNNKKPNIFPGELLAGSTTSKRKGVLLYPEFLGLGIWPELLSISIREKNPYKISIEDIMELDQNVFPFWMDKSVPELVRRKLGDEDISYRLHEKLFLYMVSKYNCQSHTIPDYKRVLKYGIVGLIQKIDDKLEQANDQNKLFYNGLKTALEGVVIYSKNLSKEARNQAEACQDQKRKQELERISEICEKVPLQPATTFREALQSIWTTMNALYQEQNNVGFSIGRIDQLLNPYYLKDLQEGRITQKGAIELLGHFWAKIGDNIPLVPENGEKLFGATGSNQAITIGGCDKEGKNAVNETTMLCLDVAELLKIRDPNLNARVSPDDPDVYSQRWSEVIVNTGSTPSLINDGAVIPALVKTNLLLKDARDYGLVGCLEPNSNGRHFGHTGAILINLIAALELALYNGNSRRAENLGPNTGKITQFRDFSQFMKAVKTQLEFIIKNAAKLNNACGEIYKYLHPQPLLSAIFEGPIDSGRSLLQGGAVYNSSGIAFIALTDLIDSLYTIKKLVFDEQKVDFKSLLEIIDSDFKKDPKMLALVRNKLAHFGNGIEEVDDIGNEVIDFLYKLCRNTKNYRNGYYNPGYWSMTIHSGFGKITGAYPHGKRAEEALASGLTPVSFGQKNGPTGVCNSLAFLDSSKMPNGMALNLKFNKGLFKTPEKLNLLQDLIKAYFSKGGMQVQFTIHDAKTLMDARENPDAYPDLMVRISGYTAYFSDLNDHMKDEIINRALMHL